MQEARLRQGSGDQADIEKVRRQLFGQERPALGTAADAGEVALSQVRKIDRSAASHSFFIEGADKIMIGRPFDLFTKGITLAAVGDRSEEHTSELQSLMRISYAVFCLKKKNKNE